MKKTISFNKNIEFPTMIGEITAISLDHNLKFIDQSNIIGDLKITGRYKMTEASRLEEDFNEQWPVEILLTEKIDLETAKVDIEDFHYEIENDDTMTCYIDIKVEGLEILDTIEQSDEEKSLKQSTRENKYKDEDENYRQDILPTINTSVFEESKKKIKEDTRECDGENNMDINSDMISLEVEKESINHTEENNSLFLSFKDSDETFATYSVYILRQEETIQTIIEKYKITKEELEKYNDLTNLTIGSKIIIPTTHE